jgi:hypothetical protein
MPDARFRPTRERRRKQGRREFAGLEAARAILSRVEH